MQLLHIMAFYLAKCWAHQRRSATGSTGLQCPPQLQASLELNKKSVVATITDGNCGLHSFAISFVDEAQDNEPLQRTAAYKEVKWVWNIDVQSCVAYLRARCVTFMTQLQDVKLWEDMTFKDMALNMSSIDETFPEYVVRMKRNNEWVDAAFLHALACSFRVDLMLWQERIDSALLGHSCTADASSPLAMLHVALKNDLHFSVGKEAMR